MNEIDTQRFNDLYSRFEAGHQVEALDDLRDLARGLDDPWDKAELIYHEILFLLDMDKIPEARQRLWRLNTALASLTKSPPDGYEIDVRLTLPVMTQYAEARVTFAEGKEPEALRLIESLVSQYPKQLSTPEFHTIFAVTETLRGWLLADAGRWVEAKPFLEGASPPEAWKGVHCCYLGQCYYRFREYQRARDILREALNLGLTRTWEGRARYVLGLVEYHLSDKQSAKRQFELSAKMADPEYLEKSKIWEWLEATSRDLGLFAEAENYRKLRITPKSKPN